MTSDSSLRSSQHRARILCINIHVKIVYTKFRPFVEATTRRRSSSRLWPRRRRIFEGGEGRKRFRFEGGHYPIRRRRVARPPPWNMAFLHLAFECLSSSLVIFVKGDPWNVEQKESATGTEAGAQKERRIIYSNEEPQLTKCRSFLNVGYLFQNRSSRFHHFRVKVARGKF